MKTFFLIGSIFSLSFCLMFCLALTSGCEMISNTEILSIDFSSTALSPGSWYVSCYDGENEQVILLDGDEKKFCLTLEKNTPAGILVYPVNEGWKERPLGALYPFQNEITETGGFVAYIADRLYRGSENGCDSSRDYLARFNWPSFIALCEQSSDPWELDSERIIFAIASGRFKKSDVKRLKK